MQVMRHPKVNSLHLLSALLPLIGLLLGCLSCSEWDTDSLGAAFTPANSQVRSFTHLVYVEYSNDDVHVWGPHLEEVEVKVDGQHVILQNHSDSLALFAYGYPALADTLTPMDGSLTIQSDADFALYLNGLALRSQSRPVLQAEGRGACHAVLCPKSNNILYGNTVFSGPLSLSGVGALSVHSQATSITAASLRCQYGVTVTLSSAEGDGITLRGPMRSSAGSWTITAEENGICTPDSIVLIEGTYTGTARNGAFLEAPDGVICRRPKLIAASAWGCNILDSAAVALRYDSVQAVWHDQLDTLTLVADTTYQIYRNDSKTSTLKFKPRRTVEQPWLLLSDGTIHTTDTIQVR